MNPFFMYDYFKGYLIREGTGGINGAQLRKLNEAVGWCDISLPEWQNEKFEIALKNSAWAFTVWDDDALIGMVRVVSDRVMAANFLGESANGIYAISYKLPTLLTTITTVFTHAWIYSAVNENESEDKEEYTNYVFKKLVAIIFLLSSGMMMIIKPFLSIYVTKEYFSAWQYTPFLFIGFTFLTLASFLSSSYNVNKDSKGFLFSGTGGAIVNIVLNFILIPIIGISGAAIATCLSYIAVFVYRIIDTKKYVKINIFYKEFFLAVLLIITQAVCLFINNMFGQCLLIIEFLLCLIIEDDVLFIKSFLLAKLIA